MLKWRLLPADRSDVTHKSPFCRPQSPRPFKLAAIWLLTPEALPAALPEFSSVPASAVLRLYQQKAIAFGDRSASLERILPACMASLVLWWELSFTARRVAPAASKRSSLLAQVPASCTVLQTTEGIGGSSGSGGLSSSTAKLHSCAPLSSGAGKPANAHCSYSRVWCHQSHGRDVFKPGRCRVVGRGPKMSMSSLRVPLQPVWSTGSGQALKVTSLWLWRKEPGLAAAQLCAPTAASLDANFTLG